MDLGVPHIPEASVVPAELAGLRWRVRTISLSGKEMRQFLVLRDEGNPRGAVLASGFDEAAAVYFAKRNLAHDAIKPEDYFPALQGYTFGIAPPEYSEGTRCVTHACFDQGGEVVSTSSNSKEDAARDAYIPFLASRPLHELNMDEFRMICATAQVRSGRGSRELKTIYDGDTSEGDGLRILLSRVYSMDSSVRHDGEDRQAFGRRLEIEILKKTDFSGVHILHVPISIRGGELTLNLVCHRASITPENAMRHTLEMAKKHHKESQSQHQREAQRS